MDRDSRDEHFGSEPPGPGWSYAGDMRWTRDPIQKPRVAIVGGGPGGLFTAYILNQRLPGAEVTIFEASEKVGGKICTDKFSDGTPFEAGVAELYEYKGPGGKDPMRLLIEDDLKLKTVDIAGGGVILKDQILRDFDELEKIHGLNTRTSIEAFHRKMVDLMPLEKYALRWQPDNNHPWADKTFHECIEKELTGATGIDEVAQDYIETAVHSDLATESHTCNGLNGIKNVLMDNDQYMQLYHVVSGIGRVVDELSAHINAKVLTSTRVTGVSKIGDGGNSGRYTVSTLEDSEDELVEGAEEFDAVVVALPNHWLRTIQWSGKLAKAIHSIVSHYDLPAHYLRVTLLFDKKWWAELELPGEFWMMDMANGCCCYDESTRWAKSPAPKRRSRFAREQETEGHVLSFLLAGGDALLMCSAGQDDECIVEYLLQSLPTCMREDAEEHLLEAQVDRFVGSINAMPGGWPAEELRGEHHPEPEDHPGVFLVGDYLFDSTLNAALMSANIAVELLLEQFGIESGPVTDAIKQLESKDTGV
jgi:protoporphyrinogen oxidase